jgi:hypothetical protein
MRLPDGADFGRNEKGFPQEAFAFTYKTGLRQDAEISRILPCLAYTLTVSATELNSSSLSKFM